MRKIQNTNISFRATTDLKQRLTECCLENDLHNSSVILQALASYLRQETKEKGPRLIADRYYLKHATTMAPQDRRKRPIAVISGPNGLVRNQERSGIEALIKRSVSVGPNSEVLMPGRTFPNRQGTF